MRIGFIAGVSIAFLLMTFSSNAAFAHKNNGGGQAQQVRPAKAFQAPRQNFSAPPQRFGAHPNSHGPAQTFGGGTRTFGGHASTFGASRGFGNHTSGSGANPRRFGANAPSVGGRHFGGNAHSVGNGSHSSANSGRTFGHAGQGFHGVGHGFRAQRWAGHGRYFYHGHSFSRFRTGYYRWPHGYHYIHYGVGAYFPNYFWINDYYITDYADYGLDAPPDGFIWTRYGPDLVLFDQGSGQIAQVIPNAFVETADGDDQGDSGQDNQAGDQ